MHIIWKGHEVKSQTEIIAIMRRIHDDKEVRHFMDVFEASYAVKPVHSFIFKLVAHTNAEIMKELLLRFLNKNCNEDFYIIEGPTDGRSRKKEAVLKVRIITIDNRSVFLHVIEPSDKEYPWRRLNPRNNHYLIVDGPAAVLTRAEWIDRVMR